MSKRRGRDAAWKNNPAVAILAILAIVLVIVISLVVRAKTSPEARINKARKSLEITVVCESCQAVSKVRMGEGGGPAYKCPKCEKNTAYQQLICQDCGQIYLMKKKILADNACPNCGKTVPTFYYGYAADGGN